MHFFAAFNHWLHLFSVIFWIGGTAFQVLVSHPLMKSGEIPNAYLHQVANRFRHITGPLLMLLVVTGGINFGFRRVGHEFVPPGYIAVLAVKVFLFAALASLYMFDFSPLRQEIQDKETPPPSLFAKWTLVIGVMIVFLAATLRHWKF